MNHSRRPDTVLPSPAYTSTIADGRTEILKELAKTDAITHAVSVVLLDDRGILWEEAFGLVDKTRSLRPNPETLFCIASLSKIVAAVGTMMLVDRGLVGLDEPVTRYLRDFRMTGAEVWRKITVRMLLNHSSGLPGTHFADVLTVVPVAGYAAQVQRSLARQRLKHAPGEMAVYCNDGFTLIERVVAEVTGQSYVDFVRKEILGPLEMRGTRFALERFAPGSFAPGLDGAGRPEPQEYVNVYAGGLFSTPREIARLAMMFLNAGQLEGRRLLSAEAVAEMGRDQTESLSFNPVTDHPVHFGLGWDGVNQGGLAAVGVTAWHKSGDADHYHSHLIVVPEERLAAVVMITNALCVGGIANLLAERILLHALAERGSIPKVPEPRKPAPIPAVPSTDDDLAAIAGIYASSYGLRQITVQPDRTLALAMYAKGGWRSRGSRTISPLPSLGGNGNGAGHRPGRKRQSRPDVPQDPSRQRLGSQRPGDNRAGRGRVGPLGRHPVPSPCESAFSGPQPDNDNDWLGGTGRMASTAREFGPDRVRCSDLASV